MTSEHCQSTNLEYYAIVMRYYKDGVEHIPSMNFLSFYEAEDVLNEKWMNFNFLLQLNKPYEQPCYYSPTPHQAIEGFIYDGFRVMRSKETEEEFENIERCMPKYTPGRVKEIWKYYFHETWRGVKTYTEHPDGKCTVIKSPFETTRK